MTRAESVAETLTFRAQDVASIELVLILAIVALVCFALYDLFPRWR